MSGQRAPKSRVLMVALGILCATPATGAVFHVDDGAAPGGTGAAWADALPSISEALAAAQAGDEVWVAEGEYRENLIVPEGVSLFGGFAGKEAASADARPRAWITIVAAANPAIPVVTLTHANLLQGFVIRGGAVGVQHGDGPRLGTYTSSVRDCLVEDNDIGVRYVTDPEGEEPDNRLTARLEKSLVVGNRLGLVVDLDAEACYDLGARKNLDIRVKDTALALNRRHGLYMHEDGYMNACRIKFNFELDHTLVRANGDMGAWLVSGWIGPDSNWQNPPVDLNFHNSWIERNLEWAGFMQESTGESQDYFVLRQMTVRDNRGDGMHVAGPGGWPRFWLDGSLVEGNRDSGVLLHGSSNAGNLLTDNVIKKNGLVGIFASVYPHLNGGVFKRNQVSANGLAGMLGVWDYFADLGHDPDQHNEFSRNGYYDFGCAFCSVFRYEWPDGPANLREQYWGPGLWTPEALDARIFDNDEDPSEVTLPFEPWRNAPPRQVRVNLIPSSPFVTNPGRVAVRLEIDMRRAREELGLFEAEATWDPAVLRLVGGSIPGTSGNGVLRPGGPGENGRLHIVTPPRPGLSGVFDLGCLEFEPVSPPGWFSAVQLDVHQLTGRKTGENLLPFLFHVPENIRVGEESLFGDVTGDRQIDRDDARAILDEEVRHFRPWRQRMAIDDGTADLNDDGTTNATDANIVLSSIAGLPGSSKLGQSNRTESRCGQTPPPPSALGPGTLPPGEKVYFTRTVSNRRPFPGERVQYAVVFDKQGMTRLGSLTIQFENGRGHWCKLMDWWVPEGVHLDLLAEQRDDLWGWNRFSLADTQGFQNQFVPVILEFEYGGYDQAWNFLNLVQIQIDTLGATSPGFEDLLPVLEERENLSENDIQGLVALLPYTPDLTPVPGVENENNKEEKDQSLPAPQRKLLERLRNHREKK